MTACSPPISMYCGLIFINVLSVPDLIDDDPALVDAKADAVIAGADAEPAGELSAQGFRAADGGPIAQPPENLPHPHLNHARQGTELFERVRREFNVHCARLTG